MTKLDISRRTFIRTAVAAGGGMLLGFRVPGLAAYAQSVMPEPWNGLDGDEINAWLAIDPSGIVTVRCPHTEMGQGGMTSVGMMIAEELNTPWDNIRVVMASANRHITEGEVYVNMSTGGSNLVRNRHPHIMQAGASARERLKQAAAEAWGVDRADVTAEQGVLTAGNNSATYGELATAAAGVTLDEEPAIKAYGDWWLIGTEVPRMDVPVKTNGSAIYPIDVMVPDMVFAAVRSCPVPGGRLVSFNFDAIKDRPGIIDVVQFTQATDELANGDLRDGVAVVADSFHRARTALDLMPIEWDYRGNDKFSYDTMDAEARELLTQESQHAEEVRGDPRPMLTDAAATVITGDYARPYECTAPMSPPAAVVDAKPDRVDVWALTQNTSATLLVVAEQLGVDPSIVHCHGCYIGGAFGYGNQHDAPRQAAEIAKAVGRPVKVIWTREEDQRQTRTRPPIWARFEGVLGDDGLPTAVLARTVAEVKNPDYADRAIANHAYDIPNFRYERHIVQSNIPVGPNRAPGVNSNTFAIEQYADELAIAGGWDPLDWRIKMTEGNERYQRVLLKMKEIADFTPELGRGMGMGVAVVEDHGTIAGCCATVEVSRRGSLFVDKILLVTNSGYVFNPRAAREQLEGSVAWELSHALYGGLRLENGQFVNTNFDTYNLMRMAEMPQIEVVFASSEDQWWGGYGEPGGPPAPAAIANAIFFATGKRVRTTPIVAQDLSWS